MSDEVKELLISMISSPNTKDRNRKIIFWYDPKEEYLEYVNELVLDESSTGIVYMRQLITAKASNVTMAYTEIDYSGEEKTPTIQVFKDSTELDIANFKITYSKS